MPSQLSVDLRERVVSAVATRASCHRAAARFGVTGSSVSRRSQRAREDGHVAPKPMDGDHASKCIVAHAELILAISEQEPRRFSRELCDRLTAFESISTLRDQRKGSARPSMTAPRKSPWRSLPHRWRSPGRTADLTEAHGMPSARRQVA